MVQSILTIPTIKSCERRAETKFDLNVRKCLEYQTACTARAYSSFLFGFELPFWLLFFFLFRISSTGFALVIPCKCCRPAYVHVSIHPFAPVHQMRTHANTRITWRILSFCHLTSRTCYNSPFIRAQVNIYRAKLKTRASSSFGVSRNMSSSKSKILFVRSKKVCAKWK